MSDEEQKADIKCSKCKTYRYSTDFLNDKNRTLKTCKRCRQIDTKSRERTKCPHGRQCKSRCSLCLGHPVNDGKCSRCKKVFIPLEDGKKTCLDCRYKCIHNKSGLKDCDECKELSRLNKNEKKIIWRNSLEYKISHTCEHDILKFNCKKCNEPIKITIKNMINHSKQTDKKLNIYDADRFIDKCFLEGLIEEYPNCYYQDCNVELQYVEYQDDLATIERLNNTIGHIKSNCVLCCLKCNRMRKSNSK
jgi:hypothetical protein